MILSYMVKDYDKHVESIYKKVLVTRNQISQRLKDSKNDMVTTKLNKVFARYYDLLGNPKISEHNMQNIIREMTKTLDMVLMHSDEDVIKTLTNELVVEKFKKKVIIPQ